MGNPIGDANMMEAPRATAEPSPPRALEQLVDYASRSDQRIAHIAERVAILRDRLVPNANGHDGPNIPDAPSICGHGGPIGETAGHIANMNDTMGMIAEALSLLEEL